MVISNRRYSFIIIIIIIISFRNETWYFMWIIC